ncbi:hypothetical protein QZH41_015111 [Actinostola sp. cb2023]|nr:hypothetical protein QZH41_015111 [Actinostola sp. cb2023]
MIQDHVSVSGIGCSCLDILVKNPRTHIDKGKALYTDYEIELKTNHPCFPLLNSKTRRRYSEFIWLRSKLGLPDVMVAGAPKLPRKQVIGRFKESFLQDRNDGLQRFLSRQVNQIYHNIGAFTL